MKHFKRVVLVSILVVSSLLTAGAEKRLAPSGGTMPQLEFVMQLKVTLGEAYTVGDTPRGRRMVVPITGGTFSGPQLQGTIVPGGADWQLVSADGKRTELEAIYSIETDDGHYIHIRNRGIIAPGYFKAAPQFEAPADSPYGWLNNALFVCEPDFSTKDFKGIVLNVWKIK